MQESQNAQGETLPPRQGNPFGTSGATRFLRHMAVVSFGAPGVGGALSTFLMADWGADYPVILRVFASIFGAGFLLIFIWFITIPFGLLTYFFCQYLLAMRVRGIVSWTLGGAIIGAAFGFFMAHWAALPVPIHTAIGITVGIPAGWNLRGLWRDG